MKTPGHQPSHRLAMLGTLVGSLAHELKNPLSTLNLNLQLLMEDLENPASPKESRILKKLAILKTETSRLQSILEDFLQYARPQPLKPEWSSISSVIDDILEFMEPELGAHQITVHKLYSHDVELYPVDRSYFKMALVNLVVNAVHAMGESGGELIVRTDRQDEALVIHVIDTGPGIPEEIRSRVFDVYFSTKRQGTGMGLAHARRVMEEHGGSLEVDTEVGKGSDFRITLPRPPIVQPER
jgi:signal transduction histidine kinase